MRNPIIQSIQIHIYSLQEASLFLMVARQQLIQPTSISPGSVPNSQTLPVSAPSIRLPSAFVTPLVQSTDENSELHGFGVFDSGS